MLSCFCSLGGQSRRPWAKYIAMTVRPESRRSRQRPSECSAPRNELRWTDKRDGRRLAKESHDVDSQEGRPAIGADGGFFVGDFFVRAFVVRARQGARRAEF